MTIFEKHRKEIERTYRGTCNVFKKGYVTDEVTKIAKESIELVVENAPCKLSYEKLDSANNSNGVAERMIVAKLFIAPEIDIKAGSKLEITQDGVTTSFAKSGESGRYPSHQEIMLELFERWA